MGLVVVLALASIVFLSVVLITGALMMRNRWDRFGQPEERPKD